jgi:general secretion pathway protein K
VWARLFKQLNLPQTELDALAQGLLQATADAASSKPDSKAPLVPQRVADLKWLGLSATTLQAIEAFVTLLPERTPVNLNTAAPEVLVAAVSGLDLAQARAMVQSRSIKPFDSLMDALLLKVNPQVHFDAAEHTVSSRFFGVLGQLRLGQATVQERSVLHRAGLQVKVLSRTREVLTMPDTPLQ